LCRYAEEEQEAAMKIFSGTPEQQAAAVKLQSAQRGKMARNKVKQMKEDNAGGKGKVGRCKLNFVDP
jgi:hypothetical protein